MTAFVCLIWFVSNTRMASFDMQNEDGMVIAAKEISSRKPVVIACVNQFDGSVFWFEKGKQVERP